MHQLKVAIRVDAERTIGGGHAYRCLALADALSKQKAVCLIVTRGVSLSVVPALARSGHRLIVLEDVGEDEVDHAGKVGSLIGRIDLLVIDNYLLGAAFEKSMRAWARCIAAIEDAPNRVHSVDILIDQTHGRSEGEYAEIAPQTEILAGSAYALLRQQFARLRQGSLVWRRARAGRVERILVAFGATDPNNYCGRALDLLLSIPGIQMDVLIGACHPAAQDIRTKVSEVGSRVRILESRDDVAELMAGVDLAVGSAGVMSWERCTLGVPSVISISANNQTNVADSLIRSGAALCLGEGVAGLQELPRAIVELRAHPAQVLCMSQRAAELCDGQGAERAAEALLRAAQQRSRSAKMAVPNQ